MSALGATPSESGFPHKGEPHPERLFVITEIGPNGKRGWNGCHGCDATAWHGRSFGDDSA